MHRCFRFPPDTRRSARESRRAEAEDQREGEARECPDPEVRQGEEAGEQHLTRPSQENKFGTSYLSGDLVSVSQAGLRF